MNSLGKIIVGSIVIGIGTVFITIGKEIVEQGQAELREEAREVARRM